MKNIYLIGFMGTGKSSVGKLLAQALKRDFIEMDELIEDNEKLSISDIFRLKGEAYFRDCETKLIDQLSQNKKLVVSCGGGAVCSADNLKKLKSSGDVYCLIAKPETIYERAKDQSHRPLLQVEDPLNEITKLIERRSVYYDQADFTIETDHLTVPEVVERIREIVERG